MTLSASEIAEERRRGRRAGAAAIVAGVLFPVGLFWSQAINSDRPEDNAPAQLRFFDRHSGELVLSSAIRSLSLALIVFVALHLYRANKARNPELNSVVAVVGVFGPLVAAIGSLTHDVYLAFAAADFTGREFQTIDGAKDLTENGLLFVTVGLSIAGTLALAFWFVFGSLNAMRVGLLSRFMGVLGVIIGPAFLLGLAPPVVALWLIAVGVLFLGRWPRGLPPAWETGQAVPWPTMGAQPSRSAEQDAVDSQDGEVEPVGPGVRRPQSENSSVGEGRRSRRKRKRRR
jgi:hypothetical protein